MTRLCTRTPLSSPTRRRLLSPGTLASAAREVTDRADESTATEEVGEGGGE